MVLPLLFHFPQNSWELAAQLLHGIAAITWYRSRIATHRKLPMIAALLELLLATRLALKKMFKLAQAAQEKSRASRAA